MQWLNFLHFYQPANVEFYHIRKALDKSYWRLLRLMEEHPSLHFTINISGCLLERLAENKETAFLGRLKFLVKKKRVELVGSAAYHGFLPLLPEKEIVRQIRANEKILKKHFGRDLKLQGFFLPEMAYSSTAAVIIKRLGYKWLILDEFAYHGGRGQGPDPRRLYVDAASGLKIIFRDRGFSSAYPPDKLWPLFKKIAVKKKEEAIIKKIAVSKGRGASKKSEEILITATDAELYGLRHEDHTAELEKTAKIKGLKTLTLSRFISSLSEKTAEKVKLTPSTWESNIAEIKVGHPYILWQNRNNEIQVNLWKLANLSLKLGEKFKNDKNFFWYRWHLVRGLASCTFWWASGRDFSRVYGPYAWSPDEIERGLEDLIRSIRSLFDLRTKKAKLEAEKYYLKVKKLIWEEHWRKHWRKTI